MGEHRSGYSQSTRVIPVPAARPRTRVGLSVMDPYWQHCEPVAFNRIRLRRVA